MNRLVRAIAFPILLLLPVAAGAQQKLSLNGSRTMGEMNSALAAAFMKSHAGVQVVAAHAGTQVGLQELIDGKVDIAASSRDFRPPEAEKMKAANGGRPAAGVTVAIEGVSIYLNPKNPVQELTLTQLAGIYSGKIRNWKEVGGPDAPINAYSREKTTGKYWYVREVVLSDGEIGTNVKTADGAEAMFQAVLKDSWGIGYGPVGHRAGVRLPKIGRDGGAAVLPTPANVASGAYPLVRKLTYFLREKPTGVAKQFVDFVLGPDGQQIVRDSGFASPE